MVGDGREQRPHPCVAENNCNISVPAHLSINYKKYNVDYYFNIYHNIYIVKHKINVGGLQKKKDTTKIQKIIVLE